MYSLPSVIRRAAPNGTNVKPSSSTTTTTITPSSSTTTTTVMPSTSTELPPAPGGQPSIFEPHIDLFLSQKCGKDPDGGLAFWTWCSSSEQRNSTEFPTKCINIEGSANVVCDVSIKFLGEKRLKYTTTCPIPGKPPVVNVREGVFVDNTYNLVVSYCQETLRSFNSLPLWLILIIIFLVIAAVATTAILFWRYWLRKRLYPAEYGTASTLDSRFTSAVSSASSLGSTGPASSSALPKLSLRNSDLMNESPSGSHQSASSPGGGSSHASGAHSSRHSGNLPSGYPNQRVISLAPSLQRPGSRAVSRAASSSPMSGNRSVGSISSQGSHKSHRSHSSRSRSRSHSHSDKGKGSTVKAPSAFSAAQPDQSAHQSDSSAASSAMSGASRSGASALRSGSPTTGASWTAPTKLGSTSSPAHNSNSLQPSATPTSTAMSRQLE